MNTKKNAKKVPAIRFAGFNDDWEQRKLDDVSNFSKGSGFSKGDLRKDGQPVILYGRMYTRYETVIKDVDTFVAPDSKGVFSQGGEVIVPGSGESAEDISRASVVTNSGVLLGGDINIIEPGSELNSEFLALSISNGQQRKELVKRAQGKSVVHLHNSDLQKVVLKIPSKDEQRKISKFIEKIEFAIVLHQRKLAVLK
ncbi:restriction endonuclease subunit S, partial [Liquorilactobacillus vini]|uniref:restriction endonuclease subunit S n=2 Tax=Liquorilactobacillus vini TaxID=238015 RepID=UPI000704CF51